MELLTRVTSLVQDSVSDISMSSNRLSALFCLPIDPVKDCMVLKVSATLSSGEAESFSGKNSHCLPLFPFYIFSSISYLSDYCLMAASSSVTSNIKLNDFYVWLSSCFGLKRNVLSYRFLKLSILGLCIRSSLFWMVNCFWIRICCPS